tara:strand:- start:937 stop:1143 length:207 start_codon:yes stop_codon:yes gene_type:complete
MTTAPVQVPDKGRPSWSVDKDRLDIWRYRQPAENFSRLLFVVGQLFWSFALGASFPDGVNKGESVEDT